MQFFSFFDVLPSTPTTTRMTLMPLMFHILLISLFSFWYLSVFSSLFDDSYVSGYSYINCGLTSLIHIHYNKIWFLASFNLPATLDHKITENLHFFIFNNTFWSMFIPFFTPFQVLFPTEFPLNYSCYIIVPSLVLLFC